jgi:hypothetical protein
MTDFQISRRAVLAFSVLPFVPRRRPDRPPPPLAPPSMPFPPSRVGGPVTHFPDPATFHVLAFEAALRRGGTIVFGRGTFDISAITPQALSSTGVRVEGQGKHRTTLRGNFSLRDDDNNAVNAIVGILQGRLEIENLTFAAVRAVFVGPQPNEGMYYYPDRDGLVGLARHVALPEILRDGIALRNFRLRDSGRLGILMDIDHLDDVYMFDVEVLNCWHVLDCDGDNGFRNWLIYNCRFQNFVWFDNPNQRSGKQWQGCVPGFNFHGDFGNAKADIAYDNIRFEHCTFNGMTCLIADEAAAAHEPYRRLFWVRGGGFRNDCWFKNCLFKNLGYDQHGRQQTTYPYGVTVAYTKGNMLFENCIVDNGVGGGEAVFNTKGYTTAGDRFRNVWVKNWRRASVETRRDGLARDNIPRGLIGVHRYELLIDNLFVENCEFGAITSGHYSSWQGDSVIKNVTIRNCRFDSDEPGHYPAMRAVLPCFAANESLHLTVANVRIENVTHAQPEWLAAVQFENDPIGSIAVRDVVMDLRGNGFDYATLLHKNVDGEVAAVPTGAIIGTDGAAYAITGAAQTPLRLEGTTTAVAGATLDWAETTPIGYVDR